MDGANEGRIRREREREKEEWRRSGDKKLVKEVKLIDRQID